MVEPARPHTCPHTISCLHTCTCAPCPHTPGGEPDSSRGNLEKDALALKFACRCTRLSLEEVLLVGVHTRAAVHGS
jgi:hypothetical protein